MRFHSYGRTLSVARSGVALVLAATMVGLGTGLLAFGVFSQDYLLGAEVDPPPDAPMPVLASRPTGTVVPKLARSSRQLPQRSMDREITQTSAQVSSAAATGQAGSLPYDAPVPGPAVSPASAAVAASALTLDQAINLTLTNDPKIRAGLESINQAHADFWTASLRPNPELNLAGGLLPLSRPFTPADPAGPSEFDVGLSYGIDWFLFGKRAAAMASATWGVCVSESEYADLVRQRVTETALAFYDVVEAKASLDLAGQNVENLQRVEAVTRKAVENGGRPQVEMSRVRLDLLSARREQRDAESALVAAKASLRALLGSSEADPAFDVAGSLDGPLTAEPLPVEEAYAMATRERPDIEALRRKVSRSQADTVVEYRNAFPEVTSDFGIAHQYQRSIGANDATMWGTGLTLTVPLFNRNQGNRSKAASVVTQSSYELQSGLVELRAEIVQVVQALHTAQQNAASVARDELRLAGQVRDAIGKAYEAGGRPLIDVLDAQRNFRETYRIYITSRAEYWRSLYKYNSAIGKQVAR